MESTNQIMNENQFIEELKNRDIAFSRHQAMSGSQYWTILSVRYRKSDHYNPNKCLAIENSIEVSTYSQFMDAVNESVVGKSKVNTVDEWIYNEKEDYFEENPNYVKI